MHARPPTDDASYLLARQQALRVAPLGFTCTHTTKLTKLRGDCLWCNTYWAARLQMEVQWEAERAKGLREPKRPEDKKTL